MPISIIVGGKDVTPACSYKNKTGKVCGKPIVLLNKYKNGDYKVALCEKHANQVTYLKKINPLLRRK